MELFENCDLTGDLLRACKITLANGTSDNLALFNLDKLVKPLSFDSQQENVVTTLVSKFGSRAYLVQGINDSNRPVNSSEKGTYKPVNIHALTFNAWGVSPEFARQIDNLKGSRIAAVYKDNNGFYRVQGTNAGMELLTSTQDPNDEESGGAFTVEMEGRKEIAEPYYLAIYDYTDPANPVYDESATEAVFNSLFEKPKINITGLTVSPGAAQPTVIQIADTSVIPSNYEITIRDIVGTAGTVLNNNSFAATVLNSTDIEIQADTSGLVYTSGGTIE